MGLLEGSISARRKPTGFDPPPQASLAANVSGNIKKSRGERLLKKGGYSEERSAEAEKFAEKKGIFLEGDLGGKEREGVRDQRGKQTTMS